MSEDHGRILALDLGKVRIGVALSDLLGCTAQPLQVLRRVGPRKDLHAIAELAREHEARTIVVGLPLELSGDESEGSAEARETAQKLQQRLPGVELVLWDERLTTVQAQRSMVSGNVRRSRRKQIVDALAAVLILQNYLDSRDASQPGAL